MFKFHVNFALLAIFVASELLLVHADVVPVPVPIVPHNDNLKLQSNKDTQSDHENSAKASEENSQRSSASWDISGKVIQCAISLDGVCLLNEIENMVNTANKNLLREADEQARMATGRKKNDENSPSNLISSITDYVLDVPEILKESISGLIKSGGNFSLLSSIEGEDDEEDGAGKDEAEEEEEEEDDDKEEEEEEEVEEEEEADEDEDEKDEDEKDGDEKDEDEKDENTDENAEGEDETSTAEAEPESRIAKKKCSKKKCLAKADDALFRGNKSSREIGDARGRKKKKKKALFKLFVVIMLIKAKIGMLLKILAAKLQIKFLIIAAINLLINLARFWWDLKKGHDHPQKVIYYEHAQHQHHYDGHEDWQSSPGGGGGYWGRSYDENGEEDPNSRSGQQLAYSKQIPYDGANSDSSNDNSGSWNLWG